MHDGSSPTIGISAAAIGAYVSTSWRARRVACGTNPFERYVRPQQRYGGTSTWTPAAARRHGEAARGISGSWKRPNVSAKKRDARRRPSGRGRGRLGPLGLAERIRGERWEGALFGDAHASPGRRRAGASSLTRFAIAASGPATRLATAGRCANRRVRGGRRLLVPLLLLPRRLERRHVDRRRALGLARLARDAQVERLGDLGPVSPSDVAGERLAERVRAAARRVLLLARRHERRAHGPGADLAAHADPLHASTAAANPTSRAGRVEEREAGLDLARVVVRAHAQRLRQRRHVDDLARVEQAGGVEGPLGGLEGGVEAGRVEVLGERAARAAVAVLARDHAAVLLGEARRGARDPVQLLDLGGLAKVEKRPHVEAAGARVRVHRRRRLASSPRTASSSRM